MFKDPVLNKLHSEVVAVFGEIKIGPALSEDQYFTDLVESIISQQLATKVATTISNRVHAVVGIDFSPTAVLATPFEKLRGAGLSTAKANYIRNIAEAWVSEQIIPSQITLLSEEAVIQKLSAIKGVGRWTAEMFLMFCLARPDVFSVGDYGLRKAMMRAYNLSADSKPQVYLEIASQWQPHRTLASRILWKSLELPTTNK